MGQWWPAAGSGPLSVTVYAWDLLKEVTIYPTIELPELTQDWEIDSRRAKQNLVHQEPRRKEQ